MNISLFAVCCVAISLFAGDGFGQSAGPAVLPGPTGAFPVGTKVYHLTDTARRDPVQQDAGRLRELMIQVWYPADDTAGLEPAAYVDEPGLIAVLAEAGFYELPPHRIESWLSLETHAFKNARIRQADDAYPLLIFSHGLGLPRFHYTSLVQDLASHGYIVVAIDHPYGGATMLPDGRVLNSASDPENLDDPAVIANRTAAWAADASFVADLLRNPASELGAFTGDIDFDRIGMLGHSLGGAAALEVCIADQRFRACANLDGAPFGRVEHEGIGRPALIMGSGPDYSDDDLVALGRTREQWERMGEQYLSILESVMTIASEQPAYLAGINGTGHMSYSDAPFVMPETITRFGGRIIDPYRGFEIITTYIRSFFDLYLVGKETTLFSGASPHYPEVTLYRFNEDTARY